MKKSFILLYLILIPSALAGVGQFQPSLSECPGMRESDAKYYKGIFDDAGLENNSKKGDIESEASTIFDFYQVDCNNKKFIKRAEKKVKRLIRKGQQIEVKKVAKEIKRISDFRKPEKEWKKLEKLSSKLGKDPFSFISRDEKKYFFELGKKSQKAIESKCINIDNRRGPLKGTVRDQGEIGWCYAYVAADLLSHKYGKLVSAFDIANSYNNEEKRTWLNYFSGTRESEIRGGFIESALNHSIKRGICLENNVRSSDFKFAKTSEIKGELKKLEAYKDAFDQSNWLGRDYILLDSFERSRYGLSVKKKARQKRVSEFFGDCSKLNGASWRNLFPGVTNQQVVEVLLRSSKTDIVNQMVKEGCKNKRIILEGIDINSPGGYSGGPKDYLAVIDDQLDKENIIGIGYNSSILVNPSLETSGRHTSSIVARKFNKTTNSCDYLIRNSWGEGCSIYADEYDCEKGHVWIPKNQISKGIIGVTYID